jgi:hypothetical protein
VHERRVTVADERQQLLQLGRAVPFPDTLSVNTRSSWISSSCRTVF